MSLPKMLVTLLILLFSGISLICGLDLTLEAGHLKPFGFGKTVPIDEIDNFANPKHFFKKYVWPLKPLKMKGAAKMSQAYNKWNDDYFLSLPYMKDQTVSIETKKKESRQQEVLSMSFLNFVRTYNNTENYMVDAVPESLRYHFFISSLYHLISSLSKHLHKKYLTFYFIHIQFLVGDSSVVKGFATCRCIDVKTTLHTYCVPAGNIQKISLCHQYNLRRHWINVETLPKLFQY